MTSAGDLLVDFPAALRDAAVVDEAGVERLAVELKGARRGVVVVGSSISGLVLASRLSRTEGVTVRPGTRLTADPAAAHRRLLAAVEHDPAHGRRDRHDGRSAPRAARWGPGQLPLAGRGTGHTRRRGGGSSGAGGGGRRPTR